MVKNIGEKYECIECGLVVVVEDDCGCASCALMCCDVPMKKVKAKAAGKPAKKAKKVKAVKKRKQPKNFFMPAQ